MPGLGWRGKVRIAGETAWGNNTPNALGVESLAVESESLISAPQMMSVPGIRDERVERRRVQGAIKTDGGIVFPVDVEDGIGILLKNTLPQEDFTSYGAGNGALHVFRVGDLQLPPGICMRVNRDTIADASNIWDYVGGRVKKMSFAASEGQILKCTADLSFQKGTQAAPDFAASYTTQQPLVYWQGAFTVNGQPRNAKSFKLDISTGLIEGRGVLGSQFPQQAQPGMMQISGEVDMYFDSLAEVNDYLNATDVDLKLNFSGSAIGNQTRQLQFELPTAYFKGTPPVISNTGEILLKMPFVGYRSGNGNPDDALVVSLLNSIQQNY